MATAPKIPEGKSERYKLTVSGIVTYGSEDSELRDLLLQKGDDRARLPEALQEIEESVQEVTITMERL